MDPSIILILTVIWAIYVITIALWIIWEKREPVATLSWLLALSALPIIGYFIYHLLGPRRIKRQRLKRLRARSALLNQSIPDRGDPAQKQLAELVQNVTGISPVHMIDPVLLRNGDNTYDAMLEAIANAKHSIHLITYIFDPDNTGDLFRQALTAKAKSGVKVRLLLDSVGSMKVRSGYFKELIQAGGELSWFHPVRMRPLVRPTINHRNHRKVLIVDGTIGFTGGINISDTQNSRFRDDAHCDLHLRFTGSAVHALQLTFVEDWAYASGVALRDPSLWPTPAEGGTSALMVPSGPDTHWESFHRVNVESIHDATQRVWLVTPYFVPSESARMALTNASLTGVDVRLLIPKRADSKIVSAAARSFYDEMLACGIRIFEYQPNLLHAKAMLIDQNSVFIGSGNFDYRSFRVNFELSTYVYDQDLADEFVKTWEDYLTRSVEITKETQWPRWQRMLDACARLLSPLL